MRNMPHISSLNFLHGAPCFLSRQVALWVFFLAIPFEKWSWLGVGFFVSEIQEFPAVSQHCRVRLLMKSFFHCCGSKVCNLRNYVEGEKRSGIDPDLFRDPNKISVEMDIVFTFRKLENFILRWRSEGQCIHVCQNTSTNAGDAGRCSNFYMFGLTLICRNRTQGFLFVLFNGNKWEVKELSESPGNQSFSE